MAVCVQLNSKMHHVQLTEPAYEGFMRRANAAGLSVDEYLNKVGSATTAADGFTMTPEMSKAIDKGLQDIAEGRTSTWDEAMVNLEKAKELWRAERKR